jgi:F-type H+-transporting ATPase subunit a
MTGAAAALVAQFHPPSTKDFVWDCWGPSLNVGGLSFCLNFINFLVLLGFLLFIAFFFFGLRNPSVVPGRMQSLVELGIQVAPGINFSSNSRIAFPLVMAVVAWVTYNAVGVMKHGFFGYLKHVMVPPGAPAPLYVLLVPI